MQRGWSSKCGSDKRTGEARRGKSGQYEMAVKTGDMCYCVNMSKIIAVSAALLLLVSIGIGLSGLRHGVSPLDAAVLSIFALSALLNSWAG